MTFVKTVDFKQLGDGRGALISLEGNINIPFEIKRVYYIYNTLPSVPRGFHAHKKLEQLAVCLKGSCELVMDDGRRKETITLDSPDKGVLIEHMQWHEMHNLSEDCILIILANDIYDESDYIRDYTQFLELVNVYS